MDHRKIQLIKVLSQEALRLFWEDSFGEYIVAEGQGHDENNVEVNHV